MSPELIGIVSVGVALGGLILRLQLRSDKRLLEFEARSDKQLHEFERELLI